MRVLDSSALLAYLQGEPGAEVVRHALSEGAAISTANWCEVAQKLRRVDTWHVSRALLLSYPLQLVAVTVDDAEAAAALWHECTPLSLTDRLCLALADQHELTALTADRAWQGLDRVELLR